MPNAIQLYRDFLAGKPGTCIFTGEEGCHAFVTEDEIDATFGSRHDTRPAHRHRGDAVIWRLIGR